MILHLGLIWPDDVVPAEGAAGPGRPPRPSTDHGPHGIRTNAVALGSITTDRYEAFQGGEPEPDGPYADFDEDGFWEELLLDFFEDRHDPDFLKVAIDWERAALPALQDPVLPEGARVDTDGFGESDYGYNSTY